LFKQPILLVLFYPVVFFGLVQIHEIYGWIDIRFFYFFWLYAVSCMLGRLEGSIIRIHNQTIPTLIVTVLCYYVGSKLLATQIVYFRSLHITHIIWSTIFMICSSYLAFSVGRWLVKNRTFRNLGNYIAQGSYFTYLFHRPLWGFLIALFSLSSRIDTFLLQFFLGIPLIIFIAGFVEPLYQKLTTTAGNLRLERS
jgi:hypothetical protein